jgi:hypothetical protein
MRRSGFVFPCAAAAVTAVTSLLLSGCVPEAPEGRIYCTGRLPGLYPDYAGLVIPPNIAPLNFVIKEKGSCFHVTIRSAKGRCVELSSRKPGIRIPGKAWQSLLAGNAGRPLQFDVFTRSETGWRKFMTFSDTVAAEPVDPYLVYRKITLCVRWMNMGIFQRSTGTFSEVPLINSGDLPGACMNCHSFRSGNPARMILQLRSAVLGTPMLIADQNNLKSPVSAVDTKTSFTSGRVGFTAWHPAMGLVVFSVNSFTMLYHSAAQEVREVFDQASDLALYNTESGVIEQVDGAARADRIETMPEWSPDGRYLYFCSAPRVARDSSEKLRCDLMRIPYNGASGKWGEVETILCAEKAGGSVTQPRISPDGRFILVTCSPYSDFPIHQAQSHLCVIAAESGAVRQFDRACNHTDAWHCWSRNGRWIVFTSKRMDRRFARPFFSYVSPDGALHKPFVLPQRDPAYYRSSIMSYNIPELVSGPVEDMPEKFVGAAVSKKHRLAAAARSNAPAVRHPAGDVE